MSEENVEIVRAGFEAWNARDLDALRELYDPQVIVRATPDWPEPGPFVGREVVMRQGEQLRETWDAVSQEPISDFIDVGDRVAVRHIWRGVGHGPSEVNPEFTVVFTLRKGNIRDIEYFWDHAEALEAMGLSE
jgi:ketosteroid isomerase-like protein